jgi:hypothetical protein
LIIGYRMHSFDFFAKILHYSEMERIYQVLNFRKNFGNYFCV